MPTTTALQALPVMTSGDDPDIPADILSLANAIEKRLAGVYNNVADRDAKITSPEEGQFAYLKDSNKWTHYTTTWVDTVPDIPEFTHGTVAPNNADGANGDVYFRI